MVRSLKSKEVCQIKGMVVFLEGSDLSTKCLLLVVVVLSESVKERVEVETETEIACVLVDLLLLLANILLTVIEDGRVHLITEIITFLEMEKVHLEKGTGWTEEAACAVGTLISTTPTTLVMVVFLSLLPCLYGWVKSLAVATQKKTSSMPFPDSASWPTIALCVKPNALLWTLSTSAMRQKLGMGWMDLCLLGAP